MPPDDRENIGIGLANSDDRGQDKHEGQRGCALVMMLKCYTYNQMRRTTCTRFERSLESISYYNLDKILRNVI